MGLLDVLPPDPRRLLERLCRDRRDTSTGEPWHLALDVLFGELGWTPLALREAGDFLVEAGLARWVDERKERVGFFTHHRIAATVEGESIARHGVSPAEIRRQVTATSTTVSLSGSTLVNSSVQIGEGNVAAVSSSSVGAPAALRVALQWGVLGPQAVPIVAVNATNHGASPVVVSGVRWCMRSGEAFVFARDSLGVLNGSHTIPPGDDYSLIFDWPTFRTFLQHDLVAASVQTKAHGVFRSDPEEFRRIAEYVLRDEANSRGQ